ncbi:MAG: benzoate-CoA ligase family protein [Pseudomonadota bacterium]
MVTSIRTAMADEIGYSCPSQYNASRLLFDNLNNGNADQIAVLSDSGSWKYRALAEEASRVGQALLAQGFEPMSRIAMLMDDEPRYPAAIMGALRAGFIPILVNTLSTPDQIRFILQDSGALAIIVSSSLAEKVTPTVLEGTDCRMVLVSGDGQGEWLGWDTVASMPDLLDEAATARDDMAFWMYSSGTTGKPKGVIHRHEDPRYANWSYARHILRLAPGDVCYSIPKVFFAYGFGNSVIFPFAAGAAAVLAQGRPEPSRVFEQIAKHRPTVVFALPTVFTALMGHPATASADLSSVRKCISAAEVLSGELADLWEARFGHRIVEGLGSTEMTHIYLSNTPDAHKVGSAGRRVPGYAIRLLDQEGREVGPGEEGSMEVCGVSATQGYWNRPDKDAESLNGEWLRTGDRFVRDDEGFYFFKGRNDDLVKVSGQWLWPHEIEHALSEHPSVHECAVLAREMDDKRMTVAAYVVPSRHVQPGDLLSRELRAFVKKTLLPHKYPREIYYLDELPKTGTQKLDRQALRTLKVPELQ